jgi:hypothetical protein
MSEWKARRRYGRGLNREGGAVEPGKGEVVLRGK